MVLLLIINNAFSASLLFSPFPPQFIWLQTLEFKVALGKKTDFKNKPQQKSWFTFCVFVFVLPSRLLSISVCAVKNCGSTVLYLQCSRNKLDWRIYCVDLSSSYSNHVGKHLPKLTYLVETECFHNLLEFSFSLPVKWNIDWCFSPGLVHQLRSKIRLFSSLTCLLLLILGEVECSRFGLCELVCCCP